MGVKRTKRRAGQSATAKYDASGTGRRIASWNPPSSGPQNALVGFERLRSRARDATRNDWAAESGVQKWTTTIVGTGIVPRWDDESTNDDWLRHTKVCDADGVLDAYGQQALGIRSWASGGEVFLRRRWRDESLVNRGYLEVPVQYQLIESEFCPMLDATAWPGMPKSHDIRQGIERNIYGRRIAFWMYPEHPGDGPSSLRPSGSQLLRISATDVAHVFEPTRPGQLRGVSFLAPILVRLRASGDLEDATLDRMKLANLFVAFLKRAMPPNTAEIAYDPATGLPRFYDATGNPLMGLEPGIFQTLNPGEEVQFANPPSPGTDVPEYMRMTNRNTAAGAGMPYEVMSGDLADVSDRTLRVVINEFRRFAEQRQWHLAIPNLCQPMVDWWAEARGLVDWGPKQIAVGKRPTWHPQGWEYIHPVQDVEGKLKAIEGGLSSRTAEIQKRGDDPRKVDEQRAADQKRERDLKIEAPTAKPTQPAAPPQPEPNDPNDPNGPNAYFWRRVQGMQESSAQAQTQLVASIQALAAHFQAQPQTPAVTLEQVAQIASTAVATAMQSIVATMGQVAVGATNALQAQAEQKPAPVTVTNNVEPTPVTVVNHVEPTPLQVTNEIQPAAVSVRVTADVNLPDREIVTEDVQHDAQGRIIGVRQVEKTIIQ